MIKPIPLLPDSTIMPSLSQKNKTLLIGWDAADWKAIHPLLDAGKMPHLKSLIEGGVMGNIATLQPALSPMLWTSIATGKRPFKHGIHGFTEPDPITSGIRPVTNLSRRTKAIWNILNQEDRHTITIGWWPSHPAEPLSKGVMVSNDYQKAQGHTYEPEKWPMKEGTVHPGRLSDKLRALRFHPAELIQSDLGPFMPSLADMTQEELDKAAADPRMQSLMSIIADCASIHAAATALITNEPWDLMSVYYDAIDHFGHGFMKYHPPQREGISDWDYRLFNFVNEAGYCFHDMMLGTLIGLARQVHPDVTIVLMSDHGFHPDDLRTNNIPNEPAGPAAEHRQFGIFAINGPGIRKDAQIFGANLLDICPTLLHHFGLPVGEDMDGKVLLDIYEHPPSSIARIPSWDQIPGDHGMHPSNRQITPEDSKAALDQLIALGYIDEPNPDQSKALEETVRELDYNLAQSWADGGIYTEAIAILEKLYAKWPLQHRFGFLLASCYQSLGRIPELRATIDKVIKRRLQDAEKAQAELEAKNLNNPEVKKDLQEAFEKMTKKEQAKFTKDHRNLFSRAHPNLFAIRYYEATADYFEKKYPEALEKLSELDDDYGSRLQALTLRGETYSKLQRWTEAEQAYRDALTINHEAPSALLGLARIYLAQKKFEEAILEARTSAGLLFFQPRAHYLIGLAHYRLGQFEQAQHSFKLTVHQAPLFAAAWRMLAQLAQFHRCQPEQLIYYRLQLKQARERMKTLKQEPNPPKKEPKHEDASFDYPTFLLSSPANDQEIITIISGLPRSGTSLMMQIVEAAGLSIFTDGKRLADDSNQRGYYEHDRISGLLQQSDRSWLAATRGQALKIVAPLLSALPLRFKPDQEGAQPRKAPSYRILFMERDIREILASQSAMLQRLGKKPPQGDLAKAYQQQVTNAACWIQQHQIPTLGIDYHDLVHGSDDLLRKIAAFLGTPDKLAEMQAVIDPRMHRARIPKN